MNYRIKVNNVHAVHKSLFVFLDVAIYFSTRLVTFQIFLCGV